MDAGVENVRFEVADVELTEFPDRYEMAFSRFGTMFFANPVAALQNVRKALEPGGRLVMVVWRAKVENVRRLDLPINVGTDVDQAIDLAMALGPAGEILRLAGDRAAHLHEPIREALREGLADWVTPDGLVAPASTWIVSASVPA